jgi:hypothetical protein
MASGNASTSVVLLFELIKNHWFQQNQRTIDPGFFQNLKELMIFKKRTINELVVGLWLFVFFFFSQKNLRTMFIYQNQDLNFLRTEFSMNPQKLP